MPKPDDFMDERREENPRESSVDWRDLIETALILQEGDPVQFCDEVLGSLAVLQRRETRSELQESDLPKVLQSSLYAPDILKALRSPSAMENGIRIIGKVREQESMESRRRGQRALLRKIMGGNGRRG